jgi:hypothetical protein
MMSLANFMAFAVFIFYPCMPPRLLPVDYGFVDTVNLESAESVWMSGKFVNKLAAMPSMHFGYAFCIGSVFVVDSGVLRGFFSWIRRLVIQGHEDEEDETEDAQLLQERSALARASMFAFGVWYPAWILLTIVATANHYFLDALMATFVVVAAYICNRGLLVFLPLEDLLLWILRIEKPTPTSGRNKHISR